MLENEYYKLISTSEAPMFGIKGGFEQNGKLCKIGEIWQGTEDLEFGFMDTDEGHLVDYHTTPDPVFSEYTYRRIKRSGLDIDGVQFLRGFIEYKGEKDEYWYCHFTQRIFCLDHARADASYFPDGDLKRFNKIALDDDKLSKIPLENRRFFALGENVGCILMHESLMKVIKATRPTGLKFMPAAGMDPIQ